MKRTPLLLTTFLAALAVGPLAACGGDDGDGGGGGGGGGGDDGPDAGPSGDVTAPEVVSISPEDGATGVIEEPIVIQFSEPMDQATVNSVFADSAIIGWNEEGTEVTIAVEYPYSDTAAAYQLTLPTTVTDLAGNGLAEEFTATFALAPLKTATLEFVGDLTGTHLGACGTIVRLFVGDIRNDQADCPNTIPIGGLSFALTDLEDDLESIHMVKSATVFTQYLDIRDAPQEFGDFEVAHAIFASRSDLDTAALYEASDPKVWFTGADIVVGDSLALDVKEWVETTLDAGQPYFQLRIRSLEGDGDAENDYVYLRRWADEYDPTVGEGVTDPDPDQRARLEIEYFVME
ncbi:MAG TPA: Ig-like domain-containing protein [Kofleriaceae bacterium]|nr:Ig-like domain-containing protein [Kofleriaceae bacterium]